MFITQDDYAKHLANLCDDEGELSMAVAFWGAGAHRSLPADKRIKIICNLQMGGTNPEEIAILAGIKTIKNLEPRPSKCEVRHLDDLHAKVVISSARAIVGSANMSTNGMNIEDKEKSGWIEAGYTTDRPDDVNAMRHWFEAQWERSNEVTVADLAKAQKHWNLRTKTRISMPQSHVKSVLDRRPVELDNKPIYVVFWKSPATPEGEATARQVEDQMAEASGKDKIDPLYYFEGWEGWQTNDVVISVYMGKGAPQVDGPFCYYDYKNSIQLLRREATIEGEPFGVEERETFRKLIRGNSTLMARYRNVEERVELAEVLRILQGEG